MNQDSNRCVCLLAAMFVVISVSTVAAQDEDADFPPGLLAEYRQSDQFVRRVDSSIQFEWGQQPPDARLVSGPFTATWTGMILVRQPGVHTFHADVDGFVKVFVDDQQILKSTSRPSFVSGKPLPLTAGDHAIRVEFETTKRPQRDARNFRLHLFWSSEDFTLEPVPEDILFRNESDLQLNHERRGQILTDAFRCAACHQQSGAKDVLKAPDLRHAVSKSDESLVIARLLNPASVVPNSHMPEFGFEPVEATAIAAFLRSVSNPVKERKVPDFEDDDANKGQQHLISLGCAACHSIPGVEVSEQALAAPYEGPSLHGVASLRSVSWLDQWLQDPSTLNSQHRMPVFDLSKDERRQLIAALAEFKHEQRPSGDSELNADLDLVARGKQLVIESNCVSCHSIPTIERKPPTATVLNNQVMVSGKSCLRAEADKTLNESGRRVPRFHFEDSDRVALQNWFNSVDGALSHSNASDHGQMLLRRNGCIACHDRDAGRGLSSVAAKLQDSHPALTGMSQGFVPPSLTAVGDRMKDEYLQKAVAGEQSERRLPWLLVRMPKFTHSDVDRQTLTQHLISMDRIPDSADRVRRDILNHVNVRGGKPATSEELLLANQLTGAGGFNCVACHKAGPFEPRNVALGTRGSDLMTMGERLRPRFFQRWMKNPIRVVTGIEMPAIKKAQPDVLDGSLQHQIATVWNALSDERFTPPTVTSRFEQVVNVEPGGAPRIVRDVFTIGVNDDRDSVARAFAIGFGNGHNILIDLDTMQVRQWTFGEFARQRTEGKSWYWDMAGTSLWRPEVTRSGRRLFSDPDLNPHDPVEDEGRHCELISYDISNDKVRLITRSWYDSLESDAESKGDAKSLKLLPNEPHGAMTAWTNPKHPLEAVVFEHTWEPTERDFGFSGWIHHMRILDSSSTWHLDHPFPDIDRSSAIELRYEESGAGPQATKSGKPMLTEAFLAQVGEVVRGVPKKKETLASISESVSTVPGFEGRRLALDTSIMPTAMAWLPDGTMTFTSLKGHVWKANDSDGDGLEDSLDLFEEGLSAPFGILVDGDAITVSHKPEVVRLRDIDGDGRADEREIVASGWGYNDNYHDWTTGLVRDDKGNIFVGLGSDYSQKSRPENQDRWRGGIIRVDPSGVVTPVAMSFRYPMGLAFDANGNLWATDNQGVQNTFNEINHILPGRHYGVPSRHQPTDGLKHETPGLMIPHPWVRSMNSILFLPDNFSIPELRGHGIGCEYDNQMLIRFTIQKVNGVLQGASYNFSRPNQGGGGHNFIGPICSAVSPDGAIYIGSIWDSGWQGGRNNGGISRLVPSSEGLSNGVREVKATASGFEVSFFGPIDEQSYIRSGELVRSGLYSSLGRKLRVA